MRLWRLVILALGGLRRTPLRVGLTVLGVTVGSGALVSMVAFALGIQRMAEAPFEMLGLLNNIEVLPGKGDDGGDQDHWPARARPPSTNWLTCRAWRRRTRTSGRQG